MKLYIFTVVKCEVINIKFLSKDLHRVHCDINPPLKNTILSFLPSLPPPSNLQTIQISFLGTLPRYIGFS